ncbi:MAG TPA: DinB family protein [Capsulimonadaceae bacterium]|nr:DinB family protein [Capsulimonadaceae bacterium]
MQSLRDHVVANLRGGQAYDTFESITCEFKPQERGVVPAGAGHSAWQILEHIRISQRDILDFSRNENGDYKEKKWPDEYWPKEAAPADPAAWDRSIKAYQTNLADFEALVTDPKRDLFAPFPWGDGQTLLREALMADDHAGYHLGQLVMVKRLLG